MTDHPDLQSILGANIKKQKTNFYVLTNRPSALDSLFFKYFVLVTFLDIYHKYFLCENNKCTPSNNACA